MKTPMARAAPQAVNLKRFLLIRGELSTMFSTHGMNSAASRRASPPPREDPDPLGRYPRTTGLPFTQDSRRPMLVMGRPPLVTFVQRSFEDSTAHRWAGSLMEDAGLSRFHITRRGERWSRNE